VDVGLATAGPWQRDRWIGDETERRAAHTFDVTRQNDTVVTQRQTRQRRRGHRVAAEERHRNAVVHLLIDQHANMLAFGQRADGAPCRAAAFRY